MVRLSGVSIVAEGPVPVSVALDQQVVIGELIAERDRLRAQVDAIAHVIRDSRYPGAYLGPLFEIGWNEALIYVERRIADIGKTPRVW